MEIISSCGLKCHECGAYIATVNNDDELRKKTAREWSEMHNSDIKPEDINCLGCHSEVLFSYCSTCDIRKCNVDKSQSNCAACSDFGCDRITEFMDMVPQSKEVLTFLKQQPL